MLAGAASGILKPSRLQKRIREENTFANIVQIAQIVDVLDESGRPLIMKGKPEPKV